MSEGAIVLRWSLYWHRASRQQVRWCGSQGGSCDWSVFSQLISDWLLSWNTNSCCSQIVASLVFNCYRQNSEHFCDLYNLWFILKLKLCCMFIHFNNFRITRFPPLPWILRRAKVTSFPHVRGSEQCSSSTSYDHAAVQRGAGPGLRHCSVAGVQGNCGAYLN